MNSESRTTGSPRHRRPAAALALGLIGLVLLLGTGQAEAAAKPPATATGLRVEPVTRQAPAELVRRLDRTAPPPERTADKDLTALLFDDFESGFPGSVWTLFHVDPNPHWGAWTCWSTSGSTSVGCAAGGSNGIDCGEAYWNEMETWMVSGPLSLAEAGITAATFQCDLNLNAEANYDFFYLLVSIDGTNYNGSGYTGAYNGTVSLDLSAVPDLGNLIGQAQVWVACVFVSDVSNILANGAQVDDVAVIVDLPTTNEPPTVTVTSPNGGESLGAGAQHTITYIASDPDDGPSALTVAFDYSTDSGANWTAIATGEPNTGAHIWTLPDVSTTTARVRVRVSDGADETPDTSDADFAIVQGSNTLALGSVTGTSGTTVTVPLNLTNENPVKGIQFDVTCDDGVASFAGVTGSGRGAGLRAEGEIIAAGQARVLLFFDAAGELAAGDGEVGRLSFALSGAGAGQTALNMTDAILSGPEGQALAVSTEAGQLTVEAAAEAPRLQIAVLQNPGRVQTFQIMVVVSNGSGTAPTVAAAGSAVTLTPLGGGIYLGQHAAAQDATEALVTASDTNDYGTGTAQVTVSF